MPDPEVLVAGAGPTGLALACGLRAHGVSTRVVDRAAGPATTSRANILFGRGVEVLRRLDALGDLPRHAVEPLRLTTYINGKPMLTMQLADFRNAVGVEHQALYVSQARIEERLRQRLHDLGTEVEWDAGVLAADQDTDGVGVELATGERVRVSWLVGCDGAHSAVRKLADVGFPGVPVIEQFLLADVHLDWDRDRGSGGMYLNRDGLLMAIPMHSFGAAANLWRLMANVPAGDTTPDESAIIERFDRILADRGGSTNHQLGSAEWTSVFRIQRRLADDYRRGRILLAGDAAHIHSPVGGQGMNTGMGDAENLAWKLALVIGGGAAEDLLDTYGDERRPLAADVLKTTTANTRLLVAERGLARFLRDRVLFPIGKLPAVQRRNAIVASQLRRSYRRGPLGGGFWSIGKPRPGDRIPDGECRRVNGEETRLYAELAGSWAMLVPPDAGDAYVKIATDWLGTYVTPLIRVDGRPDMWLIRPDGHLAWRGRRNPKDLDGWLYGLLRRGRARR